MDRQAFKGCALEYLKKHEQGSTWNLALYCKIPTPRARALIKKLAAEGYVQLCERYTNVNNLVWKLTDKAKGE